MLKSAVSSYNDNTLEDAIKKYVEAIEQASEAENKIETVKDYTEAKNTTEEKKKKNVDHLKIARGVLPVI